MLLLRQRNNANCTGKFTFQYWDSYTHNTDLIVIAVSIGSALVLKHGRTLHSCVKSVLAPAASTCATVNATVPILARFDISTWVRPRGETSPRTAH